MKLTLANTDIINSIAAQILSEFTGSHLFALYGDMGAGKTTLIKAFCKNLGITDSMSSPTYAIVNQYNLEGAGKEIIYHIDLYRLKDIKEAFAIGIEEYLNSGNYCFIEWPGIIEPILPRGTIKINISVKEDDTRELNIEKI